MQRTVIDGRIVEGTAARIPATDDGLLRGDGVFELVRLYGGKPWALDEHLERMRRSARNLRLPLVLADVTRNVELLLAEVGPIDACLRLVATRAGRQIGLIEELQATPASVSLATVEYVPPELLDGVKSLSYGANMLAVRLARERDADDALFVTPHGRVLEASRASFFYAIDAKLYTPPLEDHLLDSITRRHLIELTQATERTTTREDLGQIREAFIASTTKEVLPINAIDGRPLAEAPGPQTLQADAALRERIATALGLMKT
jgi:branched-chain amino acid aminotransferase